jgi:hypothetical protein
MFTSVFSFVNYEKEEELMFLLNTAEHRISKFHMNASKRDMHLLSETMPYVMKVCDYFSVNPLFLLTLIEHESNYKWVYGDSNKAVGFLQLHLNTAIFVQKKYNYILEELGLFYHEIPDIDFLNKTPVKTMVLSTLWFCYNFQRTNGSYIKAVGFYNGIENQEYILNYFSRFSDMFVDYLHISTAAGI